MRKNELSFYLIETQDKDVGLFEVNSLSESISFPRYTLPFCENGTESLKEMNFPSLFSSSIWPIKAEIDFSSVILSIEEP